MLLIEDRLAAARDHIAAGRNDSAGLILESIIEINPAHPDALRSLAETRISQGKIDEALKLAGLAAQYQPGNIEGLGLFARVALLGGHPDIAAAAVDQGLISDPTNADLCAIKANMLTVAGDFAAAEILLAASLKRHPGSGDLLAALAQLYMTSGAVAPAIEYAQRAIDTDPGNAVLIGRLGLQLAAVGDHEHAIAFLERSYLLDPANPIVNVQLADSLLGCGSLAEAARISERVTALHPDFLPGWESWVRIRIYRGEAEAALARFGTVAQSHSERLAALLALAGSYRVAGRPADALRLLEPIIGRLAQLPTEHRLKAESLVRDCCLSLGAIDQMRQLLPVLDPDTAEIGLGDTALVIDRNLSSLEALVLLRFATEPDHPRQIHGPSSLGDLVALIPGMRFSADDAPRSEAGQETISAFPLSAILSLPGPSIDAAAAVPYIEAPADRRGIWHRSLADLPRPILGIAWDQSRPGLLLNDLRPALGAFEGTLISLVWDDSRQQLAAWPEIIDAGRHFAGLADLAALIAEIDAVIGPDGLPLHIAGAMGCAAALLSLPNPPWYWQAVEGRSVWYPSVRLLSTGEFGNWAMRIDDLADGIAAFLQDMKEQSR